MTLHQALAFAVLAGMMVMFVWGRIRYDLVAVLGLMVAVLVGIVEPNRAFSGFSDDIVIIVASALVISAAVARSGVIEDIISWAAGRFDRVGSQLIVLAGSVTFLSAVVKNIGALAMMMPAAIRIAKRSGRSPSLFLMPMAFGSLLGGLMTLVGTSPNIIVSKVREQMTGEPFGMFDYTPVGLGIAIAGLLFLRFGYVLLPQDRRAAATLGEALDIRDYTTDVRLLAGSPASGKTIAEFRAMVDDTVEITGLHRVDGTSVTPVPQSILQDGDVLILEGEPEALEKVIVTYGLGFEAREDQPGAAKSDIAVIEAVVARDSILLGTPVGELGLSDMHGVNLLAVSRRGARLTDRLKDLYLHPGDVVVLQGAVDSFPELLRNLGALPLAVRQMRLGREHKGWLPIIFLGLAMFATSMEWLPVEIAFFSAAAASVLSGALPPREVYQHIEWPIIVMIGALIPVSESLQTTGGTDLIASGLSDLAGMLPGWGAVALIMVAAMAVTPFLNNMATVLVVAPIASLLATDLGYRPEAFLMAVAVGAGSDFLTPIGHQSNTLVMGPGGYRFGDYARLGAPLSLIVILVGVPLILTFWPLR